MFQNGTCGLGATTLEPSNLDVSTSYSYAVESTADDGRDQDNMDADELDDGTGLVIQCVEYSDERVDEGAVSDSDAGGNIINSADGVGNEGGGVESEQIFEERYISEEGEMPTEGGGTVAEEDGVVVSSDVGENSYVVQLLHNGQQVISRLQVPAGFSAYCFLFLNTRSKIII